MSSDATHVGAVAAKDEPVMSSAILRENLFLRVAVYADEMRVWLQPTEDAIDFTACLTQRFAGFRRGKWVRLGRASRIISGEGSCNGTAVAGLGHSIILWDCTGNYSFPCR